MTDALAMVSHEPRIRTSSFSAVMRLVAKARASVTANGRPNYATKIFSRDSNIKFGCRRHTFRDSHDNQRNGDDENLHECNAFLVGGSRWKRLSRFEQLER